MNNSTHAQKSVSDNTRADHVTATQTNKPVNFFQEYVANSVKGKVKKQSFLDFLFYGKQG